MLIPTLQRRPLGVLSGHLSQFQGVRFLDHLHQNDPNGQLRMQILCVSGPFPLNQNISAWGVGICILNKLLRGSLC